MEDWQYNFQTNWANKHDMEDFDLEPSNMDIEMASQTGEWGDDAEVDEEDNMEAMQA
jgi:hypothetical protein